MDINQQEVAALERKVGDQAASPLFAKLAHLYLESGRAKDALRVCDAGLANYPFYSTAHLIKGKALLHLGMNGEARREFELVHGWLPTNPTVSDLLGAVPVSDDQVLEAPPTEESALPDEAPEAGEATATTDVMGVPGVSEPQVAVESGSSGDEAANVFGLPSEAPPESATVAGSGEEAASPGFGEENAFAQFEASAELQAPAVEAEADFEAYAVRKQQELGAGGVMSLEEYLASDPVPAPAPTESVSEAPDEDPFAAAGFGAASSDAVEPGTAPEPDPTLAEESPQAFEGFGDFGEQPEAGAHTADQPAEPESQESQEPPAFEGFGTEDQTAEAGVSEEASPAEDMSGQDFGELLTEESADDHTPVASPPAEDPEASAAPPAVEEAGTIESGPEMGTEETEGDIFAGFVGPGEEQGEASVQQSETAEEAQDDEAAFPDFSGIPSAEEPATPAVEETPETESATGETGGFEGPPPEDPALPAQDGNRIEELTEKLQDAKKITPVIDLTSQVTSSPSSADEAAVDAGFVTPTLAEIYAKQGWYDDAINAYKTLAKTRPGEKDKFEERVKELQEEKAKAG